MRCTRAGLGPLPQLEDLLLRLTEGGQQPLIVLFTLAELRSQVSDDSLLHHQELPNTAGFLLLFIQGFLYVAGYTFLLLDLVCQ